MTDIWHPSLHEFLSALEAHRLTFRLDRVRETILVLVVVPGERWEVEFFEDGAIEVERFISQGVTASDRHLEDLLKL